MMMMILDMIVMRTIKSSFVFCGLPVLGLKILPFHSVSSCLKELVAQKCDIQSLPDNLFQYDWEKINLRGNKG